MSLTGALFLSIVIHLQLTISLVKYFSPTTNLCIIRVARDHHRIAWGAVTLLTGIDDVRVIPHVVHVSGMLLISGRVLMSFTSTTKGTVKHAQLSAIAHNRGVIARFRTRAKNPGKPNGCRHKRVAYFFSVFNA